MFERPLNNTFVKIDGLNSFVLLGVIFFGLLTIIYSLKFMKGKPGLWEYYTYIILTLFASLAVCLANNLVLLLAAWGFLGVTLYLLIGLAGPHSVQTAKKTLVIVGGADGLMLLGVAIIYYLTGTFQMDKIKIPLAGLPVSPLASLAYLCLAIACFSKAGAIPFHSWVPDCAENAPIPVTAFLPASLDKLLGIYLLAKISLNLFVMNEGMNTFLMVIGAFTIIAAVMAALVQHNMKRLLGYHAVSQVGYMVLGIGAANPIGIAGSLFHMLNNAVYKSCLFFASGSVEQRAGASDLDRLGGLAKAMPVTFFSFLIASLSISGIPPFNGFVSKWMIYQAVISKWQQVESDRQALTYILCLSAAMFGSALTLASFMKLLHSVFLGQGEDANVKKIREVSSFMWIPQVILAFICVVFGIFPYRIPLKYFIGPAAGNNLNLLGIWTPGQATVLLLIGVLVGFLIYLAGNIQKNSRRDASYVGSEYVPAQYRPTGIEFYNTVKEIGTIKKFYQKAEEGFFDIYRQGQRFVFSVTGFLRYLHNGVLPTYMVWYLLGMIAIFLILK